MTLTLAFESLNITAVFDPHRQGDPKELQDTETDDAKFATKPMVIEAWRQQAELAPAAEAKELKPSDQEENASVPKETSAATATPAPDLALD